MIPSRRALLGATLALVPALAACSVTTSGDVTAATLDVAKVRAYGQAIQTAGTALLTAPAVVTLLGAENATTAQAALAGAIAALNDFTAAAGDSVTVSLDTSGIKAAVTTLLADAQSLLALMQSALAGTTDAVSTQISNYVASMATIVALLQAMTLTMTAKRAVVTPMTEAEALAVARGAR